MTEPTHVPAESNLRILNSNDGNEFFTLAQQLDAEIRYVSNSPWLQEVMDQLGPERDLIDRIVVVWPMMKANDCCGIEILAIASYISFCCKDPVLILVYNPFMSEDRAIVKDRLGAQLIPDIKDLDQRSAIVRNKYSYEHHTDTKRSDIGCAATDLSISALREVP